MKAIDVVVGHYKRNRGSVVDVPEWSETKEPFKVYFDPMTPKERKRINAENDGFFNAEAHVDTLIMKALDESGEPLFTAEDRHRLLTEADGAIIGRIALTIAMPTDRRTLAKN
ncbi:hypothetical protein [Roseibium polysiphoniae]|uniref:Uncharacterized protein n=1 Tax=Roseibium polysiphoniae TaxID=2571221 RepID=A0ABR9C8N0_9HYPH|nr:hypothetical protein [Roseibium polysiphoniae]MBD8875435.1 hypothetical protein [Roseibium polysiphoniae]